MATGMVDNWLNVDAFGPIYPFVGTEFVLALVGIAFWLIWHIKQLKEESAEFDADLKKIQERGGVRAVLDAEEERERGDLTGG